MSGISRLHHQCRQALFFLLPSCPSKANTFWLVSNRNLQRTGFNKRLCCKRRFRVPLLSSLSAQGTNCTFTESHFYYCTQIHSQQAKEPDHSQAPEAPPLPLHPPLSGLQHQSSLVQRRVLAFSRRAVSITKLFQQRGEGESKKTPTLRLPASAIAMRIGFWPPPVPRLTGAPCASLCG